MTFIGTNKQTSKVYLYMVFFQSEVLNMFQMVHACYINKKLMQLIFIEI